MIKQLTPEQALNRLRDYCSRAEISTGEALEKLRKWGIAGRRADDIVQTLVDERFIDDERFARAFVRDKFAYSRWGRIKIRQTLRLKKVDSEYINAAIDEEIDDDAYFETLARLLRAKYAQIADREEDERALVMKLLRFAAGRGFEPGLVMRLVREGALDEPGE